MIKAPIEFHCDGCPRTLRAEFTGEFRTPDLGALGSLFGWRHFLRGPLVCPICAENEETLARLKRQWLAEVELGKTAGREPSRPTVTEPRRCEDTPALTRGRHFSDEQIQAALAAQPMNKSAAARSLGMNVRSFHFRAKKLNGAQRTGPLNGESFPIHPQNL